MMFGGDTMLIWTRSFVVLALALALVGCDSGSSDKDTSSGAPDTSVQADETGTPDTATPADVDTPEPDVTVEDTAAPDLGTPEDLVAVPDETAQEEVYVPKPVVYPTGPFGTVVGSTLKNHTFLNPKTGKPVKLSDLYLHPEKKVLLINSSAGWCSVCKAESWTLRTVYNTYAPQGLEIWYTLFEDYDAKPVSLGFWQKWTQSMNPNFPCLLDSQFEMGLYFNVSATPMNMLVDLETMQIVYLQTGFDETGLTNKIKSLLAN